MREPVAGYASKKDAIFAMLDQGLSDDEIVFRAKTTPGAIKAYRSQRNSRGMMSREKAAKAHRIVELAIPVMAEGIGCTPAQLHHFIKRNYFGFDRSEHKPALPPEQKVDEAEPGDVAGLVDTPSESQKVVAEFRENLTAAKEALAEAKPQPEPEPAPMMVMKLDKRPMDQTTSAKFYTLRRDEKYLNLDGSGYTDNRRFAYRATLVQARKMRSANAVATGTTISPFEITKK